MEKLGVIGGMGAEATSYYYDQVVRHTAAACDQDHIDMVVLSKSTMPDRTLAIKTGEHAKLLATMKECARHSSRWAVRTLPFPATRHTTSTTRSSRLRRCRLSTCRVSRCAMPLRVR